MFHSTRMIPDPSQDFITLCQSQVALLYQIFQADWSAIYLTVETTTNNQQTNFIPIVTYPPAETIETYSESEIPLPESWQEGETSLSLPIIQLSQVSQSLSTNSHNQPIMWETDQTKTEPYQLVLPLIHQDIVLGVLVARRQHYPWQTEELDQIEKITKTLAIACSLDRKQGWYQQQLGQQQKQKQQDQNHLDNLFHQIRNPLTALKIFGKLLLKRFDADDKNRTIVENIVRESEHLQELLQEFEANQSATASDTDTITLHADSVDCSDNSSVLLLPGKPLNLTEIKVKDILEPLVMSAQSIAQEKNIDLLIEIPANLSEIWANASALREVFSNLIDNGIKYTPEQGKITIQAGLCKTEETQAYQGVAIENTGQGIPLEDQAHIFERHYRGKQVTDKISGSGLGLAIVQELLRQMEGEIELLSPTDEQHNRGTRFIVWLPLVD